MQDLKEILERNINLERQKLYNEQQHQSYHDQEVRAYFQKEIEAIHFILDEQNPLYYDFFLKIKVVDDSQYQVNLITVREYSIPQQKTEGYYYRGHLVQPANTEPKSECVTITEISAQWLPQENKWAIMSPEHNGEYQICGGKNELLRNFLNVTVKDIARKLEHEANMEATHRDAAE